LLQNIVLFNLILFFNKTKDKRQFVCACMHWISQGSNSKRFMVCCFECYH